MELIESYMGSFDWLHFHYLSVNSHLLMLFIYLPILIFIARKIYRRLTWEKRVKLPVVLTGLILAYFAPVIDVMKTGLDMHYYCNNEHGEHVYKTAETNSISGDLVDAGHYLEAGFEFIETTGLRNKLTRFELSGDELTRTLIEAPTSEYEVYDEDIYFDTNMRLMVRSVRNRNTGEILGEAKSYTAQGGWLDRVTPSLGPVFFECNKPSALTGSKFIMNVLKPRKGESQ